MRLLHTGDWHLGKRLFGLERLDEARLVLAELRDLARAEGVEAILVAGDLLDRRLVEPEVLATCLEAFEALAAVAPVVAVTGNHDDPAFWRPLVRYLEPRRVHVRSEVLPAEAAVETLVLPSGPLHLVALPWPDPARLRTTIGLGAPDAHRGYAELLGGLVEAYGAALRARRADAGGHAVLVGHLMVEHARAGGGERELTLGQTYAVKSGHLPVDLDYLALGHVHKGQPVPGLPAPGGYCGSPMQLDFGEAGELPQAVIVELEPGRPARTRSVTVEAARRLVRLQGTPEALPGLAAAHEGAWFHCRVEVDRVVPDLSRLVRDAVPGALRVEAVPPPDERDRAGEGAAATGAEPGREGEQRLEEHYAEWYRATGRPLDPRQVDALAAALAAAEPRG